MQAKSNTTGRRKRKFEDVLLPDGPNEHPLKLPKSPEKKEGKLAGNSANESDDIYPTILPSLSRSSAAHAKQSLCRRCAVIDLDTLLSRPHKTHAGQLMKKLSPVRDWDIHSCHLCSLLCSTINATSTAASFRTRVRTFSSNKMVDRTWCSISTNLLKVEYSSRYIVSQPTGINGPVKLIKENITSFDIVKTWINLCQSQHTKICSIENRSFVSGLRLIDCETKTIVPGEAHLYVALSYVWGDSSDTSKDPNKLPQMLPNTIEDAITVTKRLDYRYIWIDRYCIDQKNKEDTADQVGKMDLIYQNAELTILACIGNDPNYGLPGVGQRKREHKHLTTCTKVGRHFLISTDAWPKEATVNTKWKWNTRAWTFQEALLSRRRLVFGKRQMYFECYGMYCCEALDFPLESLHRKDSQGFKRVFCSEKRVGMFSKGVGTTPIEIVSRIEEYSNRSLTNPSDILKGMLGIFNAFQSRLNIHHYAGIPILPSILENNISNPIEGWTQSMGFFTGLYWDLESRSKRRRGFPSWSWTGWHGPVKWGLPGSFVWPSINVDPGVEINVKLIDGRTLTLEAFQVLQSHSSLYTQLSNIIHITAWTIEVEILGYRDESELSARLKLEDGGYLAWFFKSKYQKEGIVPDKLCKGIILGHDIGGEIHSTGVAILVCGKVGDTMERIGIGRVDQWPHQRNDIDVQDLIAGRSSYDRVNPIVEKPIELVKSWEEVQLG